MEARRTDEIKAELNELLRQPHEVSDARRSQRETVGSDTWKPSLSNSP